MTVTEFTASTAPSDAARKALSALDLVTASLPGAEDRPGQREMTARVADAIDRGEHLVIEAGTGTGKTLAYLTAAALAGQRTMVATATKALQDQLATKDLPFLSHALAEQGIDIDWAVLKGRSNYVCMQRLNEQANPSQGTLDLDQLSPVQKGELKKLADWVAETTTGDQSELDWSPSDQVWRSVSVGSDECPGADRCPFGSECFAEAARRRANASDITVVNTYLYGLNVGSGGAILNEHDVIVFDEAHVLEDIMSDTVGVQIMPGRFVTVGQSVGRIIEDPKLVGSITELATALRETLGRYAGDRLSTPLPDDIADLLGQCQARVERAGEVVADVDTRGNDDAQQRKLRASKLLTRTQEALAAAIAAGDGTVPFVSGRPQMPVLEIAPLDVGPMLAEGVWSTKTAILTSATIPSSLGGRVGLPDGQTDTVDVGSPFDYATQALLYCAVHLPEPRSPHFRDHVSSELIELITAAGGRTLALFTSWAAMDDAVEKVKPFVDVPILTQRDLPKPALIEKFAADAETCLFATTGLFQGVDVPGDTLSLVVIDKLPFPRPNDPLLSARRELLGPNAFSEIDIPRAATLLAQACGRLIRTRTDRGVVAVLDPRLGKARYRWDIVSALPPMKRTRHLEEVAAFLNADG